MHRLFRVECPRCGVRWDADWALRHSEYRLECPAHDCGHTFRAADAAWLDEREPPRG